MRELGLRPSRELGQNFLLDRNILGVIERAAQLRPDDVVLEVGGGLGMLSEHLAPRVGHLHVVEIDRRLEASLAATLAGHANVTLHWADAVRLDIAALQPAPDKLVANLPYGAASSVLLRTIEELPGMSLWVAMVQREVGERWSATPAPSARGAGRAYGATSVLVQLACAVEAVRPIPRTVFDPVPNVDSILIVLRRIAPAPSEALRAFVHAAFAHRRKTLAASVALALGPDAPKREAIADALTRLGHPADARAERLRPNELAALAALLGA